MKNESLVSWILLAGSLLAGFLSGWTIKDCGGGNKGSLYAVSPVVKIHDTLKVPLLEYRIIPGWDYNVDSLIETVNNFWKDSLKGFYGKGLFEARFVKEDKNGKREIAVESRIPMDPEAEVTIEEQINVPEIYPTRRYGLYAHVGYESKGECEGALGLRYYLFEHTHFSISGSVEGRYYDISWHPAVKVEAEVRL